jgi:OPT family small oligopeptide transporter
MTWIAPENANLATITGSHRGLGINPLPTLDWNVVVGTVDPLYLPAFTTFNTFAGAFVTMFVVIGIYYTNAYHTSYFPINSNLPYDRFGKRYNVTSIVDETGFIDVDKYKNYSLPYLSAGNLILYTFFFAIYTAAITHAILAHRREIGQGFRGIWQSFRKNSKSQVEEEQVLDVHSRLMKSYKEVPEWWYAIVLAISFTIGCVAVSHWPTGTSPAVVLYGVLMCAVFVIPIGVIQAMTGTQVTLNVLAEFIGGSFVEGSAVGMCFFKTYGYLTCAQALNFAGDLKLGHYVKIPPRVMFWAQMVPTFVSTFVFVGILQYQIHMDKICTADAPFRFICPHENTFFTAAVTWGTIGPRRMFGTGSPYATTLIGFPLGIVIVLVFWGLGKTFPRNQILRNVHPVILITGGLIWAPYGMNFLWPAVPVAAFSWLYIRKRFLGFWSKYNYVLSAAFSAGIAISAIIQFFALSFSDIEVDWWGNRIPGKGCDGIGNCTRFHLGPDEAIQPAPKFL